MGVLIFWVFFGTQSLRPTSLLTLLNLILLAPLVKKLETRGIQRTQAIAAVFGIAFIVVVFGLANAASLISAQSSLLLSSLPQMWSQLLARLNEWQTWGEARMGFSLGGQASQWIVGFSQQTQNWAVTHLPRYLGDAASAMFLVPVFSFFLLKDGASLREEIYSWIPQSWVGSIRDVVQETSGALAGFLRAKTLEASAVGFMAWLGLWIAGVPYAGVFALMMGVTNVIPYLGIVLGAAPPLLLFSMVPEYQAHFLPALLVVVLVNLIDALLIFPIFVARIVNLSPMILLASVAVGQEYYGLIGMLIAVPLTSILKIIYLEIQEVLYQRKHPTQKEST